MKQNNYFRRTLSAVLLLMISTLAWAYNFSTENEDGVTIYYNLIYDWTNDRTEAEVTLGYSKYSDVINIPETVSYHGETYRVTSIGDDAFSGCYALTSVTIPNSVTSIGGWAFKGCFSLTSVIIGNSVTSIGSYAFNGCSSLTSIDIPDGVTSIKSSAFENCSALTTVTIGNGVTSIEYDAFKGCKSLTSIDIPDGVTSIKSSAFENCSALTTINLPDGMTSIGYNAFRGCKSLTSIDIPDSVTSIETYTFYDCSSLTSVIIGNGVTSINDDAFENCSSLTSVIIGNSVTSIGYNAFRGCKSLTSIDIPSSVTNIEDYAFSSCSSLTYVICRAENVPELWASSSFSSVSSSGILYVPASALEDYNKANQWRYFTDIRPIEGEETVTLAIGEAHYATFMVPFEMTIPDKVEVYIVEGIKEDGETLQMNRLMETIPANTPVVLHSNDFVEETITGWRSTQGVTYTEGLLTGVYKEKYAPTESYVLQNHEGKVAFYYVNNIWNTTAVTANHAYLTVPGTDANDVKALRFGIDDETTSIQTTVSAPENKPVIYDMTGRRVEKAVKGMYVIDGKKVMVK